MSIEPLEERQLLSAVPPTLYVANSFYDQTTGANTSAPAVGDKVNWLASGQFAEVDGLTFGTNAFASIQAAATAAASGVTIDAAAGTYTENVGITKPISLVGAGAQSVLTAPSTLGTGITINTTAGTVNVAGLTINGFQTGVSVAAGSSAALTDDTVTNSMLDAGISNNGTLLLSDSSITNNLGGTGGDGGGILNGGTLTVTASTVSGNFANLGGGIYNFGTLTVSDSTIAGNSANDEGAGIFNAAGYTLTLEDSTVSANSVKFAVGGGVANHGTAYVANTIVAGNSATGTNASDPDVYGVFTSTDHDLIGMVGDATGFTTTGLTASILLGSDSASAVGLGPLANNGGPTQTMAPLRGSPAIDNGDATPPSPFAVPAADQRGQPRTFNGTLDVGAYETAPTTLYVATSFYDQTTGTTTSTPNVGDTVNWLATGQFAEVDGLTFGTNAFTSIQAAVNALGRTIDVASGTYSENVVLARPLSLVGAGPQTVLQAPSTLGTGITINTTAGTTSVTGFTINGFQSGVSVAAASSAALTDDTVTNSMAGSGIWNSGTLLISDSSVTNNLGGTSGAGGGILNGGTLTVTASTVSGNFANLGGGIYNFGTLTVSDSTIAGNSADDQGAGIFNAAGYTLTLEDSTVSANTVKFGLGGGVGNQGTAYVANTIIAGNSATGNNASDPDVVGVFTSPDHNLIGLVGDATGFTTTGATASIILGTDSSTAVGLSALANNGGPTQTMAFLPGSQAVATGDATPPSPFTVPGTDQRGQPRITNGVLDIGAYQTLHQSQEYVANSFYDVTTGQATATPNYGDTVNWPASGQFTEVDGLVFGTNAFSSIQAAVTVAASAATIDVAAGTYSENVTITRPVSLIGAGPQTVLKATSGGTGITINTTAGTTNIEDFTITGFLTGVSVGSTGTAALTSDTITDSTFGSGIVNLGTLTLSDSSVTNNLSAQQGGGIANAGTLTVIASTIAGNSTPGNGGGILDSGMLTVIDSTIANNQAGTVGGGIYLSENGGRGVLILEDSTVSGNSVQFKGSLVGSGGGVYNSGGTADVANTIIAGNSAAADSDVHGIYASTDHDLIGVVGAATGFTTTGVTASVILGTDSASAIGLGPLANNGGPTQSMALLTGSPAIDNGDPTPPSPFSVPATDQRGQPRTFNGTTDVGAYETAPTTLYVATSFYDQTTGSTTSTPSVGDTVNWLASGQFAEVDGLVFGTNAFSSIQAAVNAVGRTIDVAAGTYSENVTITRPVSLIGTGPQTVLKATSGGTGITINTTAGTTNIEDFTITGFLTGVSVGSTGTAALTSDTITDSTFGSGIVNLGTLTLSDSSVTNNASGQQGGGIANAGTLTVIASTIAGNSTPGNGGGILDSGLLTVTDSTIANNQAGAVGGGIYLGGNGGRGVLILEDSTVSGNSAQFKGSLVGSGGGVYNSGGTADVANTIIAGNSAAADSDVHGIYASPDHDLIGVVGTATGFTTTGATASIVLGTDSASAIGLGPLANNGGPTQTMALLAGSRAIDAGDNTPPAPFSVPGADQRGFTRITALDPAVDIGAYEVARLAATGQTVAAVEGASFGPVALATFTDLEPNATASEFATTIIWGDGQTSAGTVSGNAANGFTVSGSHTYAEEGAYVVAVTISDPNTFTEVTSAANVSDPAVNATAVAISATQGVAATVAVAKFTDPSGAEPTSDYSATIVWGDGQTSAGTISEAGGAFTVSGTNAYAESGTLTATVTVAHDAAPAVTVHDIAHVAAPALNATAVAISAVEGAATTVAVATFTDPSGAQPTTDYAATIVWGDGQTSAGTISQASGVFTVSGTNTYAEEGNYTAAVTIDRANAPAVTVSPAATVSDPAVNATAVPISAIQGSAATVEVATFADPGGAEPTTDYSATIVWGDGQTSAGTISEADGVFTVSGTNTYAEPGMLTATVTISHDAAPAVSVSPTAVVQAAVVGTNASLTSSANPSALNQPVTFTATVTPASGTLLPTGTVAFENGGMVLDTETLNGTSDRVSFTTKSLPVGTSPLQAVYTPSGQFASSSSNLVQQQVNAFGAPSVLVFMPQPSNTTAGNAVNGAGGVGVLIEDAYGNVVANDKSEVTIGIGSTTAAPGSAAPAFSSSTTSVSAVNGVATFTNLVLDRAGSYTLVAGDAADLLSGFNSQSFRVTPAAASHLAFTAQPANTVAGHVIDAPGSVQVSIEDKFGNVETNDASAVMITPYGPGVFAGGSTATVNAASGVASFRNLVLDAAGSYGLSANDASDGVAGSANSFTVSAAAATKIVFTALPNTAAVGTAVNAPSGVKVAIEDQYGNVETGDTATVVMTIASPSGGTFSSGSATSQPAMNGVASFTDLVIGAAGNYTLNASDAANGLSVQSGTLAVSTTAPVNVTAHGEVATSRTGFRYNLVTHLTQQTLTLSNQTTSSIAGPYQIVLTNLSPNVSLASASLNGSALSITQDLAGEPVVQIPTSLLPALAAKGGSGSSASILLGFSAPLTLATLSYTPEVLAGAASNGPTNTAQQLYVAAVYGDVLGRSPDSAGLAYWTKLLDSGAPPSGVAEAIAHSDEYYANFVIKPDFVKLLGRLPQGAELNSFIAQMDAGLTDQGVEAEIVATDEFFKQAGGTNLDWVDAVYERVLGRTPDAGGEAYWTRQLAAGQSRLQVAQNITEGQENDSQLVDDDYFHFLGRAADASGLEYWVQQFVDGKTNEDVIAGFTGSQEYYTQHTT